MRNILLLCISFSLLILFSCKNEEKQVQKETDTTEIENNTEDALENLIASAQVGKFALGDPIPETSETFEIEQKQQTRITEGGASEETIYIVSKNGSEQLILKPKFENDKDGSKLIGEIMVISEEYKTKEGIGVNSTISEFQKTYPNFKIWYTYVSDRYVLETPAIAAQFLLEEGDFIGDMEINNVQVPLEASDFKEGAKIKKIRLFK